MIESRRRTTVPWSLIATLVAAAGLALPPVAQAETTSYTASETVPVSMLTPNPCTGEMVALEGTYKVQSRYTVTADLTGTTFHSHKVEKLSLRGIAATSGAVYQNEQQQTSEENGTFTFDALGGGLAPYESTSQMGMLLIRQGESLRPDDFHVRFTAHLTYNANGVITVQRAELDTDCR